MDCQNHPTTQKLWRSFMRFNRADWHQRSIAGCTPSEIRVLFCLHRGMQSQPAEVKVDSLSNLFQISGYDTATLADQVGVKVSDIGKRLHVTAPSITQLIKGLEAKGLVARAIDATDRRAVHITLTAKGVAVIVQAHIAFAAALQGLIEHLGEAESNHLADLLNKVSRFYEEKADAHRDLWREEEEVEV